MELLKFLKNQLLQTNISEKRRLERFLFESSFFCEKLSKIRTIALRVTIKSLKKQNILIK